LQKKEADYRNIIVPLDSCFANRAAWRGKYYRFTLSWKPQDHYIEKAANNCSKQKTGKT